MQAKLNARQVDALLADFDAYLELDEDKDEGNDRAVRLVRHAIAMSAPVLLRHKEALACYLTGRLYVHNDLPEIAALREQAQPQVLIPLEGHSHAQAGGYVLCTLVGHTGNVDGVIELRDGRLVSWADDRTLRLWAGDGTPLVCLRGHTGGVQGAFELYDGRLVSWADDHTCRVWAPDGSPLACLAGPRDIDGEGASGVFELRDGRLAFWAEDGVLRLWDVHGLPLDVKNLDSAPAALRAWLIAHNADWPSFAVQRYTVGRRRQRLLWKHGEALHVHDAQTGELQAGFYTDSAITAVAFLQDERVICLGCENGQVLFLRVVV